MNSMRSSSPGPISPSVQDALATIIPTVLMSSSANETANSCWANLGKLSFAAKMYIWIVFEVKHSSEGSQASIENVIT